MMALTIENVIRELLTDDAQSNALDFVRYAAANQMTVEGEAPCWNINYKAKNVCVLFVSGDKNTPGPWTIWSEDSDYNELEGFPIDQQTKEAAWAHANFCSHFKSGGTDCGCGNQPGTTKTIFGKQFDNLCTATLMFTNPNAQILQCIKNLVGLKKSAIAHAN